MSNVNVTKGKLSFRTKISYSLGDFACTFMSNLIGVCFMFYCTNVIGISLVTIGIIMFICRVWDMVNDPIVGILVDKTHTKDGKARPWVKWFTIPLGISVIIMFTIPSNAAMGVKVAWAFVGYFLYALFYTTVNLPYGSMMPLMTRDTSERAQLSTFRMYGASIGGLLASAACLPFIAIIESKIGDKAVSYSIAVTILTVISMVLLFVLYFNCKEMESVQVEVKKKENGNTKAILMALIKNPHWVMVAVLTILNFFRLGFPMGVTIYYVYYNLALPETATSVYMTAVTIAELFGISLAAVITKKFGYKKSLVVAYLLVAAANILGFFGGKTLTMLIVAHALMFIASSTPTVSVLAMLADTLEYSEYKFGVRADGLGYAANSFATKAAPAIAGLVTTFLLDFGKLDTSQAAGGAQPHSALLMLQICMFGIPAVIALIQMVISKFYKLDKKLYEEIVMELAKRRGTDNID